MFADEQASQPLGYTYTLHIASYPILRNSSASTEQQALLPVAHTVNTYLLVPFLPLIQNLQLHLSCLGHLYLPSVPRDQMVQEGLPRPVDQLLPGKKNE